MRLTSSVFEENGPIPRRYTCDGENVNPPLSWSGAPAGAKSFALVMDDPDIPDFVKERHGISEFDHWIVFNIPPSSSAIGEGEAPPGISGRTSAGGSSYIGPCPPDREHRYVFQLFALDDTLPLFEEAAKADLFAAMEGHILDRATLVGRYKRAA